jgi:hypothetical protein
LAVSQDQQPAALSSPSPTQLSVTSPLLSSAASASQQLDGSFCSGQESPALSEAVSKPPLSPQQENAHRKGLSIRFIMNSSSNTSTDPVISPSVSDQTPSAPVWIVYLFFVPEFPDSPIDTAHIGDRGSAAAPGTTASQWFAVRAICAISRASAYSTRSFTIAPTTPTIYNRCCSEIQVSFASASANSTAAAHVSSWSQGISSSSGTATGGGDFRDASKFRTPTILIDVSADTSSAPQPALDFPWFFVRLSGVV